MTAQDPCPQVNADILKEFVPLFSLSDERRKELAALSHCETLQPGVQLFHEGDVDNQTVYLLKGQVRLSGADGDSTVISGTSDARHPLADRQPRQLSAQAASEVTVLRIDNNVLDYMITWDQLAMLEPAPGDADAAADDDGWMNKLLSSKPFRNVPPANLRALLDRMEAVPVHGGDVILRQGEPGDYYYVIDKGQAKVTQQIELAELGEGAGFGEDALISESPRNATVTMTTDGVVMRLSKADFDALLKEPLLSWVSPADARDMVNDGAVWLDVRHAREFSHYRLPNAINIPLHELRQRMDELTEGTRYICYCKTGRRSSAAAFLLSKAGFDVSVLRGGLQVLPAVMRKGEEVEQ
jgi:CRP-like cAMP-binding protein